MPTALKIFEMFFFERVPQLGHFGVESSENDWTFSNSSPQLLHRYWYVGMCVVPCDLCVGSDPTGGATRAVSNRSTPTTTRGVVFPSDPSFRQWRDDGVT
jgi:hypothetical protein